MCLQITDYSLQCGHSFASVLNVCLNDHARYELRMLTIHLEAIRFPQKLLRRCGVITVYAFARESIHSFNAAHLEGGDLISCFESLQLLNIFHNPHLEYQDRRSR